MHRDPDTRKAVKRVLPKHKHHFENLFEYKSDDEDDEDDLNQTVLARLTGFEFIKDIQMRTLGKYIFCVCAKSLQNL